MTAALFVLSIIAQIFALIWHIYDLDPSWWQWLALITALWAIYAKLPQGKEGDK